ncbi:MAG: 2-C-methyl-D-erythritol 4-phosphate cytidylyltransferase [Gammaproteobacteria bacterium]|nr:2-C-methyl-D-erythritol 4-phosphate cytidylyltransferase [Gammaproteobacteria bacterium]
MPLPRQVPDRVAQLTGKDTRYWAVLPAAGTGTRMGAGVPKQYLPLGSKTVIEHTLDALLACEELSGVVVVVAVDDEHWPGIGAGYADKPLTVVTGGSERCHSVLNGLEHLAQQAHADDWVLVHDAARPCLRPADVTTLIETLAGDAHGGLLGVPVADTMKRVDAGLQVIDTVERDGLWHALTPQMFRLAELRAALQDVVDGSALVTDEAAAMERAGYAPRMVQGHRDNIKITLPADLALAAFYLQARQST